MSADAQSHAAAEHHHPGTATYVQIAVVLFALTALEVLAYEMAHRPTMPLHELMAATLVPVLIVLSAAKFALVAMFYMHLKSDGKLLTSLFVFPIIIATTIIVILILLMQYWEVMH
ncbi:MAG: cytochrome C oxidase subunit IV family protein [Gemmatimonadales bacterium]